MTNEFDELENVDSLNDNIEETNGNDMIASGNAGSVYDYDKAPDGASSPKRKEMDGQEVVVTKAEIILPPNSVEWKKPWKGKIEYKPCSLKLHYNNGEQIENYSGTKVFPAGDNNDKYSHPTIDKMMKNQASKLMGMYADFKEKHINEVSLKEFMSFLNSKPKAVITAVKVTNPVTKEEIMKNLIGKFI